MTVRHTEGSSARSATALAVMVLLTVAMLVPVGVSAAPASEAQVSQFSPQGTVKRVRQATARFSETIVPLGDLRNVSPPFEIDCPEAGTARWVDSRTWAYDFTRDLPAGVRCTFRVRPGLRTLEGRTVGGQQTFTFSTGGPAVVWSRPSAGADAIDEAQAFVLALDAEAAATSIVANVWFRIEGVPERVGVRMVSGAARAKILATFAPDAVSGPVVVVRARRRFPNDAKVSLVWGKGVAARSGIATTQDQVLQFTTRKTFTAQFYCQREHADADCIPLTDMSLSFSAPVAWERASRIVLIGADERRWPAETSSDAPKTPELFVDRVDFKGPFPESAAFRIELPPGLRDDAGRVLINASEFPLVVTTAPFPPLAKFSSRFGIIESKADPVLPVTLRNLEPEIHGDIARITQAPPSGFAAAVRKLVGRVTGRVSRIPPQDAAQILPWLRRVNRARRAQSVFAGTDATSPPAEAASRRVPVPRPFTLPKPHSSTAFEVVGIPLESPGLYVVELASPRLGAALLGKDQPMYVPTAALVTNLSVHFKWGRENSLVWVTTLDKARPVHGARVMIQTCKGTALWTGQTDSDGIARVSGLPARDTLPNCYQPNRPPPAGQRDDYDDASQTAALNVLDSGLFVIARTDDDLSFVHSGWNQGIEPWRFQLPGESWRGPITARTIFDRALFRAGDTVHMKHILRTRTLDGFGWVSDEDRPSIVSIEHQGSNEKYELPLQWDATGSAENTWEIPKGAKLGRYQVILRRVHTKHPGRARWASGGFRVEEFRVPLMKGTVRLPGTPQVAVTEVPVDVAVQYLAGGSAGGLPVQLRAQIRPGTFRGEERFERFVFANGAVKEGIVREGVDVGEATQGKSGTSVTPVVHQRRELTLDAAGTVHSSITGVPLADTVRDLLVELEFRDPNGEVQTVSSKVPLWPAQWLVGIRAEPWLGRRDHLAAKVAVVDVDGRPVVGAHARVEVRQRRTYSYRKRLVGGFYAYDHVEEIGPVLAMLCEGPTNRYGLLLCDGTAPADGDLILQAAVTDDAGHTSTTHTDVWIAGAEEMWFQVEDSDRIDLLPEKPRYEPGETAHLQVRMPFREATALLTTEREGVFAASVVHLSGKQPVVDVPVDGAYAPNMFISVLAVRGRVGGVQPTAMVDLGKPAFKLGIAEIRVGWRAHELKVAVTADRRVYHVRDRAQVRIAVRSVDGGPPPPGSEVALAAVDEGLLELQPNTSWNLLAAMMGRRGYDVRTATAQMQVVGKRHYGLKALPQGGGGGRQTTRELFDTLLLWRGRVPLDADGSATVEVPLNDSLTSFRIAAVATGGVNRFGTGAATIRSTQDLMLLSGLPPVVREGDRFPAAFTLRNATDHAMDVTATAHVAGLDTALDAQTVHLAPEKAAVVQWDVTVPVGVDALTYEIGATAGAATDRLRVTQQVRPAVPLRTVQATLSRWERPLRQPVARPADALRGRGGVQVTLAPTLAVGLDGVRAWMQGYPFGCLEQRVSRAVALNDPQLWQAVSAALPSYVDGDGLLKYFPIMPFGSDVLTSYVLAVSHAAGLALPADVQAKMQDGLRKFVSGAILRESPLRAPDLPMRKLAAVAALARYGQALPTMLSSLAIEPNLWPTSAVLDWWSVLHTVSGIPHGDARLREAEQIIRSRLNLQGTTMGFSTERDDALWWLMVCPDTNAVRLVLQLLENDAWREDLPRLLRGALGRQRFGHWDCTVTNAWGTLAVEHFAKVFEAAPVTGTVTAALGSVQEDAHWASPPENLSFTLPWPSGRHDLTVDHVGTGSPWVTVRSLAAIPLTRPLSSGYRIKKTVTPIEAQAGGTPHRGDVLRVRLEVEAQSDMTWVVVSDPIPAGASHLGTGLARDSQIASQGEARSGEAWLAYQERAFDAYRAYYELVPKGTFVTEYTIRLNQAGRFQLPPTRVEALYAPEMFGELPNLVVEVQP